MRPTWLIEANVLGLPSEQLQAEIRRQGMDVHVVKYFPASACPRDILGGEHIPMDAFVLFIGTTILLRHIRATRNWVPGGWCAFDKLACSVYYAHFGDFLLNRNYAFLPNAELLRQEDWVFKKFGENGRIFIRPDAADKSFTGKVVDTDTLREAIGTMAYNPARMVLVAEPQKIGREWRLVVANGRVITASQYGDQGKYNTVPGCPDDVRSFADLVLSKVYWRPDPIFMIDVCESAGGLRILELNGFSCASLYLADLEAVVKSATALSLHAW